MEAIKLFQQGRLDDAFANLVDSLRRQPADVDLRYTMVGMLALRGEFDRALVHLDFIAGERPELATAVAMYVSSVNAEEERRRAYEAGHVPGSDPATEASVKARSRLRQALAARDERAAEQAMAVLAAEPPVAAVVDCRTVASLRDHDDGIAGALEVFVGGRFLWVPFPQLRSLQFTPPRGLLDLIWAQCVVETSQGTRYTCHVPALYCGSHGRADGQVRCGHKTEWVDELGLAFRGFGRRTLLAGDEEVDLLTVREVKFGPPAGA